MTIQFLGPLGRGWDRMKIALLRPFDIHKWFVVGFNAFLAGLMDATNGGSGARAGKHGSFAEFVHFPQTAWAWLMDHPGWAIAILFGAVLAIALAVVVTWASSRGVFMFLDNVVHDTVEIAKPWREYRKEGNSLFVWRIVLGLVTMASFGLLFTYFFVRAAALYDAGARPALPIGFLVGLGLVFLAFALIWGFVVLFLKDFVAALMFRNRISCGAAWKLFIDVFRKYPFHFVGYGLLVFLLALVFVMAVVAVGLATCCIGFALLAIPYISTVVTLPAWYTYRAFSLEFLGQFGPDYEVFRRPAPGAAPAPAAPAV